MGEFPDQRLIPDLRLRLEQRTLFGRRKKAPVMMKNQSQHATCPEIERLIKEIVKDDARYVLTEMRSMHRENLVVPVTLIFADGVRMHSFSRNISPVGVCLISKQPIPENQLVDLEIYRLNGKPDRVSADMRWCKPFGKDYYMSGWKFMQVRHGQADPS